MTPTQRRTLARVARAHSAGVKVAERRFSRAITAILRGVHSAVMEHVEPGVRAMVADAKKPPTDKPPGVKPPPKKPGKQPPGKAVDSVMAAIEPQIAGVVTAAHAQLFGALASNYSATMTEVMPIGWERLAPDTQSVAIQHRDWSIRLVEDAAREYAADVRDILNDPSETFGKRWEDIRDNLLSRGNVSESRAELIARDQTLKLNGAIAQAHQTGAGLERYVWSTSRDERVRKKHEELEGQIFSWDKPPEPGHPGQDFQCRCVALPHLDDLDDATPVAAPPSVPLTVPRPPEQGTHAELVEALRNPAPLPVQPPEAPPKAPKGKRPDWLPATVGVGSRVQVQRNVTTRDKHRHAGIVKRGEITGVFAKSITINIDYAPDGSGGGFMNLNNSGEWSIMYL